MSETYMANGSTIQSSNRHILNSIQEHPAIGKNKNFQSGIIFFYLHQPVLTSLYKIVLFFLSRKSIVVVILKILQSIDKTEMNSNITFLSETCCRYTFHDFITRNKQLVEQVRPFFSCISKYLREQIPSINPLAELI